MAKNIGSVEIDMRRDVLKDMTVTCRVKWDWRARVGVLLLCAGERLIGCKLEIKFHADHD